MENGEMLITKQSHFRRILLSICLIIFLIAGAGVASALQLYTPDKPVVRWMNDDTYLAGPNLPYTNSADPGKFTVYISETEIPLSQKTYQIGIIISPQTMTGEICDRPPVIYESSPNARFDDLHGTDTGDAMVSGGYGGTFSSFVPNGKTYPSEGVAVPYNGMRYYAEVTVNPGEWYTYGNEWYFPVEFTTVDAPLASTNRGPPISTSPGTYKIHVQDITPGASSSDYAASTVTIIEGVVDIQFLNTANEVMSTTVIPVGTVLFITGINTDSPFTYIWLTGGDLPPCGVNPLSLPYDLNPLVLANENGRIPITRWDSKSLPKAAGTYTIVAASQNPGFQCPQGVECNTPCYESGICGLENCPNCAVIDRKSLTFIEPELTVSLDDLIERCCCDGYPCGVLGGDSPIILRGNTGGNQEFKVWLFGEGMLGPVKYLGKTAHADNTGYFEFDINHELIRPAGINICSFSSGAYNVVVQVPWMNEVFDVIPETDDISGGIYTPTTGSIYVISSEPVRWTRSFQIDGAGSLLGTQALNALTAALDSSFIDDRYVVLPFKFKDTTASGSVDFSANPVVGNTPLKVQFKDESGFLSESWLWDFGDGQTSAEQHPVHIYEKAGTYSVTLTATGKNGPKQLVKTSYITVTASPGTNFSINPEIASVGELIQFTDLSIPKPLTYLWDFGDGTTSPLESPVHAYDTPGTYDVTLTISNQYGIGEPLTKQVHIINDLPIADFTASPTSTAGYPGRIFFTDLSTGVIEHWIWSFTEITKGVTLASNEQNPMIVFNEPGVYTVSLTVENNGGESTEVKEAYITIGSEKQRVTFTAAPMWGLAPLDVQFTDTSNIKPKTLTWDFGDGETLVWECTGACALDPSLDPSDAKRNPKHTYLNAGSYNVTLTADDGLGIYVSEPVTITVGSTPTAAFRMDKEVVGIGETVRFTDESTGDPTSWKWNFGDGSTSALQSPMHSFSKAGTYPISFSVSNVYGESGPVIKTVLVTEALPVASFSATPYESSKNPVRVSFTDTSTGHIEKWDWIFELKGQVIGTSTEQNPVMIFDKPGVYTIKLVVSNNGGSSNEAVGTVTVGNERAKVFFDADPIWGLAPLTVQFTDRSDPELKPKTLTWDFGDGETSVWECTGGCAIDPGDPLRNPKHTYQKPGCYTVTLIADDGLATYVSDPVTIIVGGPPVAAFRMDKNVVQIGEEVHFTDLSTGDPTSWNWNFGDGGTSALESPMHSYSIPGEYTISLSVSNIFGASKVPATATILVTNDAPVASFYATPSDSPRNPVRVFFTDTSTGYIDAWHWTFELAGQLIGNSAEPNPVMIFDRAGVYTIKLVVSNNGGSSNEAVGTVTVGNERARVFFDADPLWGLAPLTVQFTDRSDPELKPKTLIWDFGDGETSVWECTGGCALDPGDPLRNPKHTYKNPGCYTVTLTADDGLAIYVSEPVTITVGGAPVAAFRMDKAVVQIGEEVHFTDLSAGDPTSWNWNFGDGGTSGLQSPIHSYNKAGEYTISLSVSNIFGASKVPATATILVTNDAPVASFYATPSESPKNPVRVFFTDTSTGYIDTWHWSFELAGQLIGTSAEQNPVMIFDKPGVYTIKLVVSNNGGSSNEAVNTVTVGNERAKVFFDADPLWGPEPLIVQFTDRSDPELKPKTLIWDFGDGESIIWECMDGCAIDPTDSKRNPQHTYLNAGIYNVTLTADDGLAIYVSEPVLITVGSAPRADFRMSKDIASIGENVLFTDLSTGDPDSWQWQFGDGSWSSLRSPVHSYSKAGTYEITLTVANRYTSSLSVTKSILIVEDAPTQANIDFMVDPLENPWLPATMQCTDLSKGVVITSWDWEFIRDGIVVWCSSERNPIAVISEPGIYDVRLTIRNNGGEVSLTKERYVVVGEGVSVLIYPGWNHVSVPVELANGFNTMADIFAGIRTGAWPYSIYSWEKQDWVEVPDNYIVTPLELARVNSAEPDVVEAIFVFATKEGTYQTTLEPGWNGIGISAWQPIKASKALASIEGKWDRVIGYDPVRQIWEEPIYSTINADELYLHPGMGYLILMDEEANFTSGVKL